RYPVLAYRIAYLDTARRPGDDHPLANAFWNHPVRPWPASPHDWNAHGLGYALCSYRKPGDTFSGGVGVGGGCGGPIAANLRWWSDCDAGRRRRGVERQLSSELRPVRPHRIG